jgi:hypothetical protein
MDRREPPRIAVWMLEHLCSGERDEALIGDLLEAFRMGRSENWYWRQVAAACVMSWFQSFRARVTLLVFAFLWSLLAPAWAALMTEIGRETRLLDSFVRAQWPLSLLSLLAAWLAFNSIFLWIGTLIFTASHAKARSTPRARWLLGDLLKTPCIFLPVYVVTFVLMNLFAYPGLDINLRSITPLHEISDLTLRANVLRLPYFVTLICSLWRIAALPPAWLKNATGKSSALPCEGEGELLLMGHGPTADQSLVSPQALIAGCLSAIVAVCLLSLSIDRLTASLGLFPTALLSLSEAVFAGAAGAVLFGTPLVERSWSRIYCAALAWGPAWVWLPAMVFFNHRESLWALPVASVSAAMMAVRLRRLAQSPPIAFAGDLMISTPQQELFADTLRPIPWDWHGFAISVSLYAAFVLLHSEQFIVACCFAAGGAFVFALKWADGRYTSAPTGDEQMSAARPLLQAATAALLVTLISLMADSSWLGVRDALTADQIEARNKQAAQKTQLLRQAGSGSLLDIAGYKSIVLWPLPPKKEIVPPIPAADSSLEPQARKPLVVRFTGSYWYFQPPATRPASTSHVAHGNPLDLNIRSVNSLPLRMEADQMLAAPVRIARCREIQVSLETRREGTGPIAVGMVLTDTSSHSPKTLVLGQQMIPARESPSPGAKSPPARETLRFAVPGHSTLRRFDDITLSISRTEGGVEQGTKLAIEELEFMPR